MRSFILAGGFATRLWPLTERRAKPLLPLAGEPLLTHLVRRIPHDLSITVSTNAAFARDMLEWASTVKDRPIVEVLTEDAGRDDQKIGALGAVAKWIREREIQEDVLLLAGDNYVAFDMQDFIAKSRGNPLLAAFDIREKELAKAFGTVIVQDGTEKVRAVKSFEEKPASPQSTFVSTGCYLLPAFALPVLVEYAKDHPDNIGGIFEEFLRRSMPVDCYLFSEPWRDIGSFDAYLAAHRDLVGHKQFVDPSATIDDATQLSGSVVIGPKVHVKASRLSDCILFGHGEVNDCVIERCIIDENCDLQGVDLTGKMIRAGTVLRNTKR